MGKGKVYIETYGCQMNVNDTEIVFSLLERDGWERTEDITEADVIMANTCSVRDNAEQRIWGRLDYFNLQRRDRHVIIGILGCMAERLKDRLLDTHKVDIVAGPDAYRRLPRMLSAVTEGEPQIDVMLSREETYADINPVRTDKSGVSAFISIMRGCNNVCSYCVVPYTRGVERSRDPRTIVREACDVFSRGYREVTLLGQNVDSYLWKGDAPAAGASAISGNYPGYAEKTGPRRPDGLLRECSAGAATVDLVEAPVTFAALLEMVAGISPELRVRFATSNPQDISDEVLYVMARHDNICRHIHLPVQSGSDRILEKMRRRYTREWYLERVAKIREMLPGCGLTTDVIAGFCSETEEDHSLTLSLFDEVGFDTAFMFAYSERPGTLASRKYPDDIPQDVKVRRLNEIIALQNAKSLERYRQHIGSTLRVLVEGPSKKSPDQLCGRASNNMMCVWTDSTHRAGDYVDVTVQDCTSATLICKLI